MTDQPILEPIDERHIDFYGDDVTAVLLPSHTGAAPQIYVPIKPICDYLGLSWPGQSERIRRDPVLSDAMQLIRVTRINSRRGNPEALALPLDMLPGWLFGINAARVREELREKIIRYQRECFRVLWDAFKQDILPTAQPAIVPVPTDRSSAKIAYEIATAVQHLARQQMELEEVQQELAGRVQGMARWGKQTDDRLASLELSLHEGNYIPPTKATELSERVKALATLMTERGTKDNHYQGVFAELYRRFGVSSYKTLTNEQYAAVMAFLEQWREAVLSGSNDPPAAR